MHPEELSARATLVLSNAVPASAAQQLWNYDCCKNSANPDVQVAMAQANCATAFEMQYVQPACAHVFYSEKVKEELFDVNFANYRRTEVDSATPDMLTMTVPYGFVVVQLGVTNSSNERTSMWIFVSPQYVLLKHIKVSRRCFSWANLQAFVKNNTLHNYACCSTYVTNAADDAAGVRWYNTLGPALEDVAADNAPHHFCAVCVHAAETHAVFKVMLDGTKYLGFYCNTIILNP